MIHLGIRTCVVVGVAALGLSLAAFASAQIVLERKHNPYFEHSLPLNHAFGIDMLRARLAVAEVYPTPINKDLTAQLVKIASKDLGRIYGTLLQKDSALAAELKAGVDEVADAINAGSPAAAAAAKVRPLLDRAFAAIIDPELRATREFRGARLANLLVAEDGVSEAFEEAAKPTGPWQYPLGWGAFVQVPELWKDLWPLASAERRIEGDLMLDNMRPFYPSPEPKVPFPSQEAEDLEALAHQMVTILEDVVDSYLYIGRDLVQLASHLEGLLKPACDDYAAGNEALATERVYLVLDQFVTEAGGLAGAISVMAPELDEKARALFPILVVTRYQLPAGGANTSLSNEAACLGLLTMLSDARKVLGG